MHKAVLIFSIFLSSSMTIFSQSASGYIYDMKGTGTLKQANGNILKLTEKKDFAKILRVEQRLKADKNSKIFIVLCGEKKQIADNTTLTIPKCPVGRVPLWLEKFPTAGITDRVLRGSEDFILFPVESDLEKNIIRPETVIFRWLPINTKLRLSVGIQEDENLKFEQNDINGKDGFFTSSKLKDFLTEVREKYPNAKAQFRIQTDNSINSADFKIFPKTQEIFLDQDLNKVETETNILVLLARANIFKNYRLYIEAAEEYEEALKFSPESVELLRITSVAQDFAGNLERRNELDAQIKELERGKKN